MRYVKMEASDIIAPIYPCIASPALLHIVHKLPFVNVAVLDEPSESLLLVLKELSLVSVGV